MCIVTYTCSKFDESTGDTKVEFKTPEVNILGGPAYTVDPDKGLQVGILFYNFSYSQ